MGANGQVPVKFHDVDESSISNYAFDCRSHNTLNFYDRVSSCRDIGQNGGQLNLTSTMR